MVDFSYSRDLMVSRQIEARGITDPQVLRAMREVPRERFVEAGMTEFAHDDTPLPIGQGQTISQPYIVALMIEAAMPGPLDRVLEIGCGSGYAAAVMSRIVAHVFTIDRLEPLVEQARARFAALGYTNIEARTGDGTLGWPEEAPFDAILVAAGGPNVPQSLRDQLAVGGRLIMPVGEGQWGQRLVKVRRLSDTACEQTELEPVAFVPLIGAQGWKEGGT